ncbi:membrane protein [Mangrovimonas yunxiaonensis]|uniref:Membrane protein n=1 Tax=Mangrovimonas yunxiaonensis TaxID=1197477 RepID=A0A084THD1_9FLAO|nr:hypothetical protein [Mangrovimonas yunxiaonensis]KFB00117.1 membrane protein [Mangrovimonas yunxiaonensis]GGH41968.1 hypothetical protein GCM10011364_13180 [Mangrovimonas yunxiaonensis]
MPKKLIVTCLINFLIAALLGLLLRLAFIAPVAINFRYLVHAHSHVAMLGWVYLMLFILITHYFVPEKKRFYNRLFWVTQFAVIGMLCSFPFQGYAAVSITFSTLHIFCSYVFAYRVWKDLKTDSPLVRKMIHWALLFMVLSTLGVWCLGPAVGLMGKASAFYQIAIQFFLHFQFNGWFVFATMAILFYQMHIAPSRTSKRFVQLLIAATICTMALPIQWFAPHWSLYYINALGSVLQLVALIYFLKLIKQPFKAAITKRQKTIKALYVFSLSCFVLKLALQMVAVFPQFTQTLINHKNFIIGFIHLMMLGVISGFLFAFLVFSNTIKPSKLLNLGVYGFLIGIILTEILLAYQGGLFYFGIGMLPYYYQLLFIFSIFLPVGIALILLTYLKQKNNVYKTT